ncbi:MAG: biotin transporter BioY [Alphaproteobacteria bacterium]|nr:biotin transporter BioY [Alphaproteobacteria bacterium]
MMTSITLASRLWPQTQSSVLLRNAALTVFGSLVVALAAQISVPMWPVPMTLQTLAVLGIGAAYGSRLGATTLALYFVEGTVGLPFFAGGQAGPFNPQGFILATYGFILGFILAAWLVGKLVEMGWGNSLFKTVLATLIGGAVLYIPGLVWLGVWAVKTQGILPGDAVSTAFVWGMKNYILGDLIKAIVAGAAISSAALMLRKN